jgi:hypothetical protein
MNPFGLMPEGIHYLYIYKYGCEYERLNNYVEDAKKDLII